jgi:hypothetical protein
MSTQGGLFEFEAKQNDFYNLCLIDLVLKKWGSVMDENMNFKMEVRGSNPCFCNLRYLGHLA